MPGHIVESPCSVFRAALGKSLVCILCLKLTDKFTGAVDQHMVVLDGTTGRLYDNDFSGDDLKLRIVLDADEMQDNHSAMKPFRENLGFKDTHRIRLYCVYIVSTYFTV